MFDVDQQIQQWRRELGNAEVCHTSDLDELEIHLRDEINHLGGKGLSSEEAFLVASRRLGDRGSLTREFAKINTHSLFARRMLWVCIGVLAALLVPRTTAIIADVTALGALTWGVSQQGLYVLIPAIQVVTLIIGALGVTYLVKRYCDDATSRMWRLSSKNRASFFAALVGVNLVILLSPPLLTVVTARYFGAQDLGRVAMAKMYVNTFSPVVISLVVIGLILKLVSSRQKPETS